MLMLNIGRTKACDVKIKIVVTQHTERMLRAETDHQRGFLKL